MITSLQEPFNDEMENKTEMEEGQGNNIKQIILFSSCHPIKEHFKRKVTHMKKWVFTKEELNSFDIQWNIIKIIYEHMTINDKGFPLPLPLFPGLHSRENENTILIYIQEIKKKLYGYKFQDQNKNIYDELLFIDLFKTVELLMHCELKCFYCKKHVKIIYELVREPNQWSLERINNNIGHNVGNVVIACLNCNLKRNTMYHERYVFTKQMNIKKI
jgi:hypothetical protein